MQSFTCYRTELEKTMKMAILDYLYLDHRTNIHFCLRLFLIVLQTLNQMIAPGFFY